MQYTIEDSERDGIISLPIKLTTSKGAWSQETIINVETTIGAVMDAIVAAKGKP
jgi:hypothetical protein